MKAQDARNKLSGYSGDELYTQACVLYKEETDARIKLRSHDKPPSRGLVESVVSEMNIWMEKAGTGLSWSDDGILHKLIEWETGETWVRYKMTDPRIDDYRKRAIQEISKGTPHPLSVALSPEALNAISSFAMAQLRYAAEEYLAEQGRKKR